jgi:hypothetical protein
MRLLTNLIFALFASCVASPAVGWDGDGHRIVCAIAWDEMTSPVHQKIEDLLGVVSRGDFADTCTWADEYRDHGHRETTAWHFVNVPPGAAKVNLNRDCKEPASCVVAQIELYMKLFRSNAATTDKATALKFLAHFVGDVHQPLNVGFAKDRGGNLIKGTFFGHATNLHEIWDTDIIRTNDVVWYSMATELQTKVTDYNRKKWLASSPLDWANESLAIALNPSTAYVGQHNGFAFGQVYQDENVPVVFDRLSRAGVRLGHMLNEALGDGR